jgi:hypothetical protein
MSAEKFSLKPAFFTLTLAILQNSAVRSSFVCGVGGFRAGLEEKKS